ncbi:MAG: hypothetical protein A3I61_05755 [Acidobacteria bacterium RIFCSPLOWO2_02_FULL_68_18]|nr:MAG: hypothetical protein A3I61_05755 [Acidobacteria bacterium RIFCSPLOWO2_02_FULL_68_18]OFW48915.1 MAG: hypothetical protein A3G77_01775 [Acidobacteria bacterium RIFCSPLOWO2_12_FULL_68_19]
MREVETCFVVVMREYNEPPIQTSVMARLSLLAVLCLAAPAVAAGATDATFFRLYLSDGTSIVSFGEFARSEDRVVFSMVLGGGDEPRLHAATLPARVIDWTRTDAHASSTRYQWYARTRGEEDFQRLSDEVASVLNTILQTKDRTRALAIAEQARATLAHWPQQHYGYRQRDVREILAVLDEAIASLRAAAGVSSFELALVASAPDVTLAPLAAMPSVREQIDQALHVAELTDRPVERVAVLQATLLALGEAARIIPLPEARTLRRGIETRIRKEQTIDARYAALSRRVMTEATRHAARARITDVQRVLDRIPREDARLGGGRPDVVQALQFSVRTQLDAARQLRLLRDRWMIRRALYNDYQRTVGAQLLRLVKAQPALEAIRRLDGPPPELLLTLQARLRGGADRLEGVRPPVDLRGVHDLLLGAWRFAENAVAGRYQAARAGDVGAAWEASSAAAGALLLLSRAQADLRTLLEPPRLP